jgi:hypothetical protein
MSKFRRFRFWLKKSLIFIASSQTFLLATSAISDKNLIKSAAFVSGIRATAKSSGNYK